ncbi:Gfo/Idh/MocA family oxidoreductase [Massilia sp. Se16.2.3]|uniref:Gfo/Idh/MocA family protein n=1 Tax=Massilia sp. Se16.2.3 TaxID=2709303 RepID=UPI0028052E3F|nr:Gfo/Idh/MocA family oxidoreductase [Massilia sp. Se16.2.3]
MDTLVHWGILGTGGIARAFALALRDTPGACLAAVGSRTLASSTAFVAELGAPAGARACGSYEELVATPDVDIVYIATPHPLHAVNALMALDAGKPVLVEKPFAMSLREAEAVVAKARDKKLFLMEAMWTRFMPALEALKRVVDAGEIGTPTLLQADFGFSAPLDPEHRVNKRALGGGALLDLGIYPLSIASAILASPRISRRRRHSVRPASTSPRYSACATRAARSRAAAVRCARSPSELTVSGSLGSVRLESMFHMAQAVVVANASGATRRIDAPFLGNGYVHEALAAGEALRAGLLEHPVMTHADTLATMRGLDTIRARIGLRYPGD